MAAIRPPMKIWMFNWGQLGSDIAGNSPGQPGKDAKAGWLYALSVSFPVWKLLRRTATDLAS
eukprot:2129500-Pyramimonas_sp.AAC.1